MGHDVVHFHGFAKPVPNTAAGVRHRLRGPFCHSRLYRRVEKLTLKSLDMGIEPIPATN
jgi:hypothetical protein